MGGYQLIAVRVPVVAAGWDEARGLRLGWGGSAGSWRRSPSSRLVRLVPIPRRFLGARQFAPRGFLKTKAALNE